MNSRTSDCDAARAADFKMSEDSVTDDKLVTPEMIEDLVQRLIEAAQMYEASHRLGAKDRAFASRKLGGAKSALTSLIAMSSRAATPEDSNDR